MKWLLGILATLGSLLAIFAGNNKKQKIKKIKTNIKKSKKKVKNLKTGNAAAKKTLASKQKALEEIKRQKEQFGVERKSVKKAKSRLKKIGKGKK